MLSPIKYLGIINSKRIFVKRDELQYQPPHHSFNESIVNAIQGNKRRKLKFNFEKVKQQSNNFVITFGGPFSNHLLAVAAYANQCGVKSIGIVRGDELVNRDLWSETLILCQQYGMQFHFVDRKVYRQKYNHKIVDKICAQYPNGYIIPEGGSNALAVQGMIEVIDECSQQISEFETLNHIDLNSDSANKVNNIDYLFAACGTGGTLAGLIEGVAKHKLNTKVMGVAVLKGADFLYSDIAKLAPNQSKVDWKLDLHHHFGGYAKYNDDLLNFIDEFNSLYKIMTDQVYTGKLFYAVWQWLLSDNNHQIDFFQSKSHHNNQQQNNSHQFHHSPFDSYKPAQENVLIYHSGGLQGKL